MLSRFWLTSGIFVVLFVQWFASPTQAQFAAPEADSGLTPQPLVRAERQIVVTANAHATDVALGLLRKGGSATDAAIAAQMVLNLVEPQSSGIGGGGFLVHFDKAKGEIASYDGRETAPASIGPSLFLDKAGIPLPKPIAMKCGISVGVPGVIALLKLAHEKHGKLPWADLFQPAIDLARGGFAVSPRLRTLLAGNHGFTEEARRYFYDASGKPWRVGHILKNPALADTLERIAKDGPSAFYEGEIAQDIAGAVQNDLRIPGSLAASDFASYRAKERAPICVDYKLRKVCGMGPPSSGGVAVAQALKLVEPFGLGAEPLAAEPVHLVLEAESLAFADRNAYLADPDFVPQPVPGLLNDSYLTERRKLIDSARSHAPFPAGKPPGAGTGNGRDRTKEGGGTSHISIVDSEGNAVAFTTSIETAFGSGIMVHGFLLNNQLTDFSFVPVDESGAQVANRPEGGKRPRSSMSPTIIRNQDGTLAAVLGSPGGPVIIDYVLKSIVAHLDWGLDAQRAISLPNFGALEKIALIESADGTEGLAEQLSAMGQDVKRVPLTSGLGMIVVDSEGLSAAADPRREGLAAGD